MARARNIKPGFFRNADLVELPVETRLLFIGLWTLADREGRLEDRPKQIKMELFPADQFDVGSMLGELQSSGFISRYEVDGSKFIEVLNFIKHQDPHYKEKASEIPPPPGQENFIKATGVTRTQRARILERDGYKCRCCSATEGLCIDHIFPVSRGGDSSDDNLQVLCSPCNTKKGNKINDEKKNTRERRINVAPTLGDRSGVNPSDVLNPDSLIPSSLIPESGNGRESKAEDQSADADTPPPQKQKAKPATTLKTYLARCRERAEKPVPEGHSIRKWARDAGITDEMLQIAWVKFKERYTEAEKGVAKSYKDWPGHFATSVKDNWFGVWFFGDDGLQWSSKGMTFRSVMDQQTRGGNEQG